MEGNFQLIGFNCRSIYSKLSELKLYIYRMKPHCICLTETWCNDDNLPNFINYKAIYKNRPRNRGGGIAILLRSDLIVLPSYIQTFENTIEVLITRIKFQNCEIDILNVYEPSGNIDHDGYDMYFRQLSNKFIVIGDFNAHHPLWSFAHSQTNKSGRSLYRLLNEKANLHLASPNKLATYINPVNGSQSNLDLCFSSSNISSDITVSSGPCLGSDHYPVIVTLSITPNTQHIQFRKRWKLKDVNWPLWRMGLANIEIDENTSIEEKYEKITNALKTSNYKIEKTSGIYNPKYKVPGWDAECSCLTAIRKKAKNKFRRYPTEQNLRNLRKAENDAKSKIKEKKATSWQNFASSITSSTKITSVWSAIKTLKEQI